MRLRTLSTLTLAGALALAACGDDDDAATDTTAPTAETAAADTTEVAVETTGAVETTEAVDTTEAPATTRVTTTTAAAAATTATPSTAQSANGYVPGSDPDADAAALTWATAFDSSLGYDDKNAVIADAEALRPTIEAYTPAGEMVGGITLEPTNVVISGDTATITYKVLFAGTPQAYPDLEGTLQRVEGAWVVNREEFCGFMTMARNPCT
ncbi:MAG: hypothetical protein ABW219_16060 [Ilumatobacteraceae bacterium]